MLSYPVSCAHCGRRTTSDLAVRSVSYFYCSERCKQRWIMQRSTDAELLEIKARLLYAAESYETCAPNVSSERWAEVCTEIERRKVER